MTEEMTAQKQETMKKSPAFLQTVDGHVHEVEPEVAELCGTIQNEMQSGRGCSKDNPISVPPTIRRNYLMFMLVYCRHFLCHKELTSVDVETFVEMDVHILCEMIEIAHYLQIKSLIDCTCEAMFEKIQSIQSSEEFFNSVNWPDNISKKDLANRMELVTRLVKEKKLNEIEQENLQKTAVVPKPRNIEDTRSIHDLLEFIDGDSKGVRSSKKKKKKNKKRNGKKNDPSPCAASSSNKAFELKKAIEGHNEINTQDAYTSETASLGVNSTCSISSMFADKLKLSDTHDKSFSFEDDVDDGNFDPSISEELDREVEDFARRLKTKPPVIYFDSSSQEVDLVQVSTKGKGSRMKGVDSHH